MRSDLPLHGGATQDGAQAAATVLPAVDALTGRAASSPGVFNPTRTKLLEAFRLDAAIVRGSGHRLFDVAGHEYLDFLSQYGAVPFGHNPPALWETVRAVEVEQMVSMIRPLIRVTRPRDGSLRFPCSLGTC